MTGEACARQEDDHAPYGRRRDRSRGRVERRVAGSRGCGDGAKVHHRFRRPEKEPANRVITGIR